MIDFKYELNDTLQSFVNNTYYIKILTNKLTNYKYRDNLRYFLSSYNYLLNINEELCNNLFHSIYFTKKRKNMFDYSIYNIGLKLFKCLTAQSFYSLYPEARSFVSTLPQYLLLYLSLIRVQLNFNINNNDLYEFYFV